MPKTRRSLPPIAITGAIIALAVFAFGVIFTSVRSSLTQNAKLAADQYLNSNFNTGQFELNATKAIFQNQAVNPLTQELPLPPEDIALRAFNDQKVLGVNSEDKWIEVDLTNQRARAWEGNTLIYEFPISSGKWGRTPTGEFRIWIKLKYTKMEGGSKAKHTYYYLPNVPYTMYFYQGFGLHGTYWHNNFGHPMSHGCVNLSIPDAEKLFYWADPAISPTEYVKYPTKDNPGTRVVIHGTAPLE
jgi:lipoprotein-anchoring transpeptidase ErfK/SrfK